MAEAEFAHTIIAPASPRTQSYRDLNAVDGSIHLPTLMTLALRKARAERAGTAAVGFAKPWGRCLSEALRAVWEIAKGQRDAIVAAPTLVAAVEPVVALRRELELLAYREDYRAAQVRRRDIETQLAHHAN